MSQAPPTVYVLHGDDEFEIARFVAEMESRLGDPTTASMNTTRLDGRSFNMDELPGITSAMPFLAKRRLVILSSPTARLTAPSTRQRFLDQLERLPPTTALALVENKLLTEEKDRKKGKLNWLEEWAEKGGERVYLKAFVTPKGAVLVRWIQDQAKKAGGGITHEAASRLAELVGEDPRLADQEIGKLLAYVNYKRPVEIDDVESLTADTGQADIFAMVDALGNRDGARASNLLHRLLEQQDVFSLFGMIVRQFRLLLLAREIMDQGGQKAEVARELKIHPFVAEKVNMQARRFRMATLESIYRRLLDIDEAIKTSQIPGELALDTLVAALTRS